MAKRRSRKSMHKHTRKRVYRRKTSRRKSRHGVKRKMRSTKKHLKKRYSKNKFQRGGMMAKARAAMSVLPDADLELYYKENNVNFDPKTGVLTAKDWTGQWNFRLFPLFFTVEYPKRRNPNRSLYAINIRQDEKPPGLTDSHHYRAKITILFDGDTAAEDEQRLYGQLRELHEHRFLDLAKNYRWGEVDAALHVRPHLVNVQPKGRWSALLQAVVLWNGILKMGGEGSAATAKQAVEMLLRYGADPNLANESAEGTPASIAQSEEIKTLLSTAGVARIRRFKLPPGMRII